MTKSLEKQAQEFIRIWGGFRASRVVLTANNLGIFERLTAPKTAAALARSLNADRRATEILLDAVVSLGLLKKSGDAYKITGLAKRLLLKDSPWYQGDMLRHADALWRSWSGLDEVVRTGMPNRAGGRDHESFIRAMHNNAVLRVKDVISVLDLRGVKTALDLGGGPGTYSIELARKRIAVTLFDLPNTLDIARDIVRKAGVRNVEFMAGDFHADDIGAGYDLILLSHILHSNGEADNIGLLRKTCRALNPGGRAAIHEFYLAEDRARPPVGALFSVNMLVNTGSGRSYTPKEMKNWLRQAGFGAIREKLLGDTIVVTGVRR
jgi:ubiquinone/menaquinone biosynthesis C-methylase UbiE